MSDDMQQPPPARVHPQRNLAQYRTMLANERTLLAYQRTAIMLAVSGVTVLKLFRIEPQTLALGTGLLCIGFATALLGFARFRKIQQLIGN